MFVGVFLFSSVDKGLIPRLSGPAKATCPIE
jgi:hypothetical protein